MATELLDLHNFMDVVTSYKCKFCSFTSQYSQGIASHVKNIHLQQGDVLQTDLKLLDVEMEPVTSASTATGPIQQLTLSSNEETRETALVFTPNVTLPELDSGSELHNISKDTPDIAAQYAEIVQEATQSMVSEGTITDQTSNEVAQATGTLEEGDPNAQTKELFLCGQCGVAFASIEDCKRHMVDEHNVMLPADCDFDVGTTATHMDASTQVLPKKRVGRKKKVKEPPAVMMNPLYQQAIDEEAREPVVETENIGKRRIRVPKALKDDYCLSKRVKIRRKTREMNKPFDLKCKHSNCPAQFQLVTSLKIHESCHNPNRETGGFVCCECSTHFLQWRTLRVHLWKNHKVDTDLYSCEFNSCNFKTDKVYKLNIHKEVHGEKRPYSCDQCSKSFKQVNQLRNHQVTHLDKNADPTSDKWYTSRMCGTCKRIFANVKCLNTHIEAVHSKIKPYICQFCGHTAARKAMLQLHLRTHTGEKPFKCEQCAYVTGDHNSLRRHRMRHTGQKPYQCQFCTYSCIQAISLKTHMKNKHPGMEGVFACNQCTYVSVNKVSLENHLVDHKNGLVDTTLAGQSRHVKPATVSLVPMVTVGDQPTNVQTFTVQQDKQQTRQQVTVTAPDLDGGVQGFISDDISTTQLIFSALSAIQQSQKTKTSEAISVDGMQATVTTNSTDGSSGHTITFHIPTAQGLPGSDPVLLLQQPVTQVDTNVQDSITVAYNTNNIQSSLGNQGVRSENLQLEVAQNPMPNGQEQVLLNPVVVQSSDVSLAAQAAAQDLLNHAATMVALRGDKEIVSLAAETADLPIKIDIDNVMEPQLVQICAGTELLQSADGTQFLQVVTSEGQPTETLLQLACTDNGTRVMRTIPVTTIGEKSAL